MVEILLNITFRLKGYILAGLKFLNRIAAKRNQQLHATRSEDTAERGVHNK